MPPLQLAFSVICIVVVIVGAYYATYYISVKSSGMRQGRGGGRNINLVERFAISKDKSFCIVEICGKVYVVGVTNQSMTVLDTLDPEKLTEQCFDDKGRGAYPPFPGGALQKKITEKLAAFAAARMRGAPPGAGGDDGRKTFGETMETAAEMFEERPAAADEKTEAPDSPEGKG